MSIKNIKGLDLSTLKIIAFVLMIIDHFHEFFSFSDLTPQWFNYLGRLSYPIFIFALSEGLVHTSNRRRYVGRLYLSGVIMEIGNLLINSLFQRPDGLHVYNNIFYSLFLTAFIICQIEGLRQEKTKRETILLRAAALTLPIFLIVFPPIPFLPNILSVEGGPFFIVVGLAIFYFRSTPIKRAAAYISSSLFSLAYKTLGLFSCQWMMIGAAPLMLLYNGKRGVNLKYFFYIGYPLHIYLLYIASCYLIK